MGAMVPMHTRSRYVTIASVVPKATTRNRIRDVERPDPGVAGVWSPDALIAMRRPPRPGLRRQKSGRVREFAPSDLAQYSCRSSEADDRAAAVGSGACVA